ncbi:unnamed protein product [Absidia cylindrospora]
MNSPAIPLQVLPNAGSLQRYPYYSTPFLSSTSSSPSSYQQQHPRQAQFNYHDYSLNDGRFYPQQQQQQQQQQQYVHHPYHQALATPPSTATTEDSNSGSGDGDGGGSPFDDENQLPTPEEFRAIVDDYLNNLSPKKRDKALVDSHRYCLIQQVLRDPRNTAISTAQFRFWVKKMFQLQLGNIDIICHDNKPVAIKEHIYDILVRAHREAHHGGRDKTSALVRRKFSWIPKELVARFVRHCPFCINRRNGGQSPDPMKRNSPRYNYTSSGTPIAMPATITTNHYNFDRHAASSNIGTSSIREECDLSATSGPPSGDIVYDHSPNYVTTPYTTSSSTCSRRPSYFSYDREEDDFLNSYPFEPVSSLASMIGFRSASASSSSTTNTSASSILPKQQQNKNNNSTLLPTTPSSQQQQQQPTMIDDVTTIASTPMFYQQQQQNYMYPAYASNNYYTNTMDMTTCSGGDNNPATLTDRQLQQHEVSTPASQPNADLISHHHQQNGQPAFFNVVHPLMPYGNPIADPVTSTEAVGTFGSADL